MNFKSRFEGLFTSLSENKGYDELWAVLAMMHIEVKIDYFNFFSDGNPSANEQMFFSKYPNQKLLLELDDSSTGNNKIRCILKRVSSQDWEELNQREEEKFKQVLKNIDLNLFEGFIILNKENKFIINKFEGKNRTRARMVNPSLVEARNIDDTLNWLFNNEFNRERGMGWFLERSKNIFVNLMENNLNVLISKIEIDNHASRKILELGACFSGKKKHHYVKYPGNAENSYLLFEKMLQNYLTIKVQGYKKDKEWDTLNNVVLMNLFNAILKKTISSNRTLMDLKKEGSVKNFYDVMDRTAEYKNDYFDMKTFDFKVIDNLFYLFPYFEQADFGQKLFTALNSSKIDEKFSVFENVNLISKIVPLENLQKISNYKFSNNMFFGRVNAILNGFLTCGLMKSAYIADIKIKDKNYINMNYELSDKLTNDEFLDIFNEIVFEEIRDLKKNSEQLERERMYRVKNPTFERETQKIRERYLVKELQKEKVDRSDSSPVRRKI